MYQALVHFILTVSNCKINGKDAEKGILFVLLK